MDYASKIAYCQLVAQLLIADGHLTDDERAFLQSLMNELELTDAERHDVFASVNADDDVELRAAKLPRELLAQLVIELKAASSVDGEMAPVEQALIDRLQALVDA